MPIISGGGGGGGGAGKEIAYSQITAPVNVVGTTAGTATTVLAPGAVTFDGAPVVLSVYSPQILMDTAAATDLFNVSLFEGANELGILGQYRSGVTATRNALSVYVEFRFTPTAAAHTYVIGCYVSSTTGTPIWEAGAGGSGQYMPSFIRFTKV